jgi:hypothetical protein
VQSNTVCRYPSDEGSCIRRLNRQASCTTEMAGNLRMGNEVPLGLTLYWHGVFIYMKLHAAYMERGCGTPLRLCIWLNLVGFFKL